MVDPETAKIIDKRRKLSELRRARQRVWQLERELSGAPERSEEGVALPEFLRSGRELSSPL